MAGKALTQNQSTGSYVDGADKEQNLQALCEATGGLASGEGQATWGQASTLVVSDTRVVASRCRVVGLTADGAAPRGLWYISSQGAGTFTITSSEVEASGTKVNYIIVKN